VNTGRRRLSAAGEAVSTPASSRTRRLSSLPVRSMLRANTRSRNTSSPPTGPRTRASRRREPGRPRILRRRLQTEVQLEVSVEVQLSAAPSPRNPSEPSNAARVGSCGRSWTRRRRGSRCKCQPTESETHPGEVGAGVMPSVGYRCPWSLGAYRNAVRSGPATFRSGGGCSVL
jgi:hypothetical protein